jgi:uncharacterized protein YacL
MYNLRYLLRAVGFAIGILIGVLSGSILTIGSNSQDRKDFLVLLAICIGGIGYIMGPHFKWEAFKRLRDHIAEASIRDIIAIAMGLAFGSLVAAPLAFTVSLLPEPAGTVSVIAVATAILGLAITVAIVRRDDLLEPSTAASWI